MYKFAINRPITILMAMLGFIIFGVMSYRSMPVNLFPDIDFPAVTIQTVYSGADALSVESKVTDLIEEAVSSIDGLETLTSNSYEGLSVVVALFDLDKSITEATNDVRDKIGGLRLPTDANAPIVKKIGSGGSVIKLFIATEAKTQKELMNFADVKIKPLLQKIQGVGEVGIIGFRESSIRISVNPNVLSRHNLTMSELRGIISSENYRASAGKLINEREEITLKARGDALSIEELENLIIQPGLRLKDIATVEDGLSDEKSYSKLNQKQGITLEVKKITGSNTLSIVKEVKETIPRLEKLAGDDYELKILQDESEKILISVNQVKFDLIYGAILAVLIVFFFLRNFTATLLSAIAIPVSILGTFAILDYLGYDLNKLSLIGLTLAIGVFIDDAIVVIENITKKMEQGLDKVQATIEGTKEIAFSVMGISAMLLAVFIPVGFMSGIIGRMFNSFAITVASGVAISYLVAIMLIPAFGAILLSPKESKFFVLTEPLFVAVEKSYKWMLGHLIEYKFISILATVGIVVFSVSFGSNMRVDFVPMQDSSEYQVVMKGEIGTSLPAMKNKIEPVLQIIQEDENTLYTVSTIGYTSANEAHKAKIYIKMKPVEQRELSQAQIVNEMRETLSQATSLGIIVEEVPIFATGQSNAPVQIILTGDSLAGFNAVSQKVMDHLATIDGVVDIDRDYEDGKPEYTVSILRENAKEQGVSSQAIANALSSAFASDVKISNFEKHGRQYDITLRFEDEYRKNIQDISTIMVKNKQGNLVSLDGLVRVEKSNGVTSVSRIDRQRKVLVTAHRTDEVGLNAIIANLEENLPTLLPEGYEYRFTGEAERLKETGEAFLAAVLLAVVLIYLILASLYESIIQPIIIMMAMPLSFVGVVVALSLAGMNFSLFVMIGLILLLGMVGKNSVLVVDFANQAIKDGKEVKEALILAGEKRLRPILMTTFAMIAAMLPLAFGKGAGYESNAPMAMAVIGGIISSTLLALIVIPVIYRILYPLDAWLRKFYEKKKI